VHKYCWGWYILEAMRSEENCRQLYVLWLKQHCSWRYLLFLIKLIMNLLPSYTVILICNCYWHCVCCVKWKQLFSEKTINILVKYWHWFNHYICSGCSEIARKRFVLFHPFLKLFGWLGHIFHSLALIMSSHVIMLELWQKKNNWT
jgi:hypothetical protein